MKSIPSGTVTFLFTDIEGSSRLAQAYPDSWETLRRRHHSILRSAIQSHDGYVFQIIGDGFCAAFHTAGAALRASAKAQLALHAEDWGQASIKVRMGIHTGQAEIQEAGDYQGYLIMSRVQRLMSAAHGGQVLLSRAAEELVCDELPAGLSLRDMGERRLKDLIRPEQIFQLLIAGLQADFPPLKTLDAYHHSLPAQITGFIGRQQEMIEVKQAVGTHRLVTLTGSGGTGKTRLALQVGADLLDRFPDGVWFIELAALTDPDLIPQTVLSNLGVSEQQGRTAIQSLDEYIRDRRLLLLLDNCEHLIEACARLADALLKSAPGLKILASSREALGVQGEMAWHVPSLSLPDVKHFPEISQLAQYEAVRLFVERAALSQPHFRLTEGNAAFVAQICLRLDGIPLAIELAAARVKFLSVEQIAARLGDCFRLLTGGSRTSLPRQQTLRALIDWSYNLLSEDEKVLFRRLAVFAGGWTLEAAEQVCADNKIGTGIMDLLAHLVDKSLVIVDESTAAARYHMLETTRQYAREALVSSGEMSKFRDQHLACYLDLVEAAQPGLQGRLQAVWMSRLDLEHDNIRTALGWSLETRPDLSLRLSAALAEFWDTRGYITEARKWLDSTLEATRPLPPTPVRVKAIFGSLWIRARQSELVESQRTAEEGLALAQALGYKDGIAEGLAYQGVLRENVENKVEQAEILYNQALGIWRELGNKLRIGQALGLLASCALHRQDSKRAEDLFHESLALFREVENEREVAGALWNLAELAFSRRDYGTARTRAEESLLLYRELEDKHGIATALRALSLALHNLGGIDEARAASEKSSAIFREIGDRDCLAVTLAVLARQLEAQNDLTGAAGDIHEAVKILHDVGDKVAESNALDVSGRIAFAQGELPEAHQDFREGLALQREMKDTRMVPSLLEGLAGVLAASSRPDDAVYLLGASQALRERINLVRTQVEGPEYDRLLSALHAQVEDADFQRMWFEGRSMTLEETLHYVLDGA